MVFGFGKRKFYKELESRLKGYKYKYAILELVDKLKFQNINQLLEELNNMEAWYVNYLQLLEQYPGKPVMIGFTPLFAALMSKFFTKENVELELAVVREQIKYLRKIF